MPGVDKEQTIHWFGCWREHPECAVARIEKLEEAMADFCATVEEKSQWLVRINSMNRFAYVTFKELLADNEEDRAIWAVTRDNLLAARKAAEEALGQH